MEASLGAIRPGQGAVEISGTVQVADQSFTSPLTEQECVAYRLEKEAYVPSNRPGGEGSTSTTKWQTMNVEEGGVPFYVADGGERVLVDGSTANLDVQRSYIVETGDFEQSVGNRMLARVTDPTSETPEKQREVADEYAEKVESANNPLRYTEWMIHVGDRVTVRGEAVDPEQTPIGSSLADGVSGPTEPARSGVLGTLKGAIGLAAEVPADPRARYKPRALERLPEPDRDDEHDDPQAQEIHETVSMFEGLPQGELSENPDAIQHMMTEVGKMTDEELRVAEEAMPDAPALKQARGVISWGSGSEFVISNAV